MANVTIDWITCRFKVLRKNYTQVQFGEYMDTFQIYDHMELNHVSFFFK